MILIKESLFGGTAVDPVADAPGEQRLQPGDALIMHPYLTHSSAWNHQHRLRLGSHVHFNYRNALNIEDIVENSDSGAQLPINTEIVATALRTWLQNNSISRLIG